MSGTAFRRKPSFHCLRSGSHETIEYCASGGREGRADAAGFVRAHFRETQEMVFDAHDRAFAFYGGVSAAGGIYDNTKTAVETVFVGRAREYNRRLPRLCSHHLVEPIARTPVTI